MCDNLLQLPINLTREHISDFSITLPLCVALTDSKLLPWYYENFINICSTDRKKSLCFSNLGQPFMGFYNNIFKYFYLPPSVIEKHDICELIISQLSRELKYCYIVLDEYYISCKKANNEKHFIHQSLIYGYDFDEKVFLAIAFNKNGHLDYLKYGYDEVKIAFEKNTISPTLIFFSLWNNKEEYKFSPERFVEQLENYVNSTYDYSEHYTTTSIRDTLRNSYGINAIRSTINLFSTKMGIDYNDFKNVHFLYEHKIAMLKKLKFVEQQGYLKGGEIIIDEYNQIVEKYSIVRMLALKAQQLSNIEKKFDIQSRISNQMLELIDKEVSCLIKVIRNIKFVNLDKSQEQIDVLRIEDSEISNEHISSEYTFTKTFSFSWSEKKDIISIEVPKHNQIEIIVDDIEIHRLFSFYAQPEKNYNFQMNCSCKKIVLKVYSNAEISDEILPIFRQQDLTYNKELSASSNYGGETNISLEDCRYWRAKEQLNGYEGSDWFEIDFKEKTKINTIVIGELNDFPRLKKYKLIYCNDKSEWEELFVHNFIKGEEQVHRFDTITATKLRIEFIECERDHNGYYEPILSVFKAYYLEQD